MTRVSPRSNEVRATSAPGARRTPFAADAVASANLAIPRAHRRRLIACSLESHAAHTTRSRRSRWLRASDHRRRCRPAQASCRRGRRRATAAAGRSDRGERGQLLFAGCTGQHVYRSCVLLFQQLLCAARGLLHDDGSLQLGHPPLRRAGGLHQRGALLRDGRARRRGDDWISRVVQELVRWPSTRSRAVSPRRCGMLERQLRDRVRKCQ